MNLIKRWFGKVDKSPAQLNQAVADIQAAAVDNATPYTIRIAAYDSFTSLPRTLDLEGVDFGHFVDETASKVYSLCREKGGNIPYIVLREALENLIHADFVDATVTIMPDGSTVRVSDHGPGVVDKQRAFLPGFTTSSGQCRGKIKGVGSGLPIIKESMETMGGTVTIEDNLGRGCVVTITSSRLPEHEVAGSPPARPIRGEHAESFDGLSSDEEFQESGAVAGETLGSDASRHVPPSKQETRVDQSKMNQNEDEFPAGQGTYMTDEAIDGALSSRQKKVFLLIAEMGEIGPSVVTKELDISLSTAYRDLVTLEELNLVVSMEGGKRKLTRRGIDFLGHIFR